jgi:hypothetical protein
VPPHDGNRSFNTPPPADHGKSSHGRIRRASSTTFRLFGKRPVLQNSGELSDDLATCPSTSARNQLLAVCETPYSWSSPCRSRCSGSREQAAIRPPPPALIRCGGISWGASSHFDNAAEEMLMKSGASPPPRISHPPALGSNFRRIRFGLVFFQSRLEPALLTGRDRILLILRMILPHGSAMTLLAGTCVRSNPFPGQVLSNSHHSRPHSL